MCVLLFIILITIDHNDSQLFVSALVIEVKTPTTSKDLKHKGRTENLERQITLENKFSIKFI